MSWWVRNPHLSIAQPLAFSFQLVFWSGVCQWNGLLFRTSFLGLVCIAVSFVERNTSITTSKRSRAGSPSVRSPASNEIISDSAGLWDTVVCALHIQLMGTNVRLPKIHKTLPEVDFESSRSPAKSES